MIKDYTNEVIQGDCLDVMKSMPENCIDTIITDPPYGLKFMGKEWDHGVPGEPFWAEALRVAKPGAMLLAFGGTRTHHRLMVAIEDAGWELRDCMSWLYGSGFPKSLDISKAIDKQAGATREVVGVHERDNLRKGKAGFRNLEGDNVDAGMIPLTAPATDDAKLWDGYGTGLKPAWEPIIVAMKPLDGTFAANALQHGVAGLNIDAGRIGTKEGDYDHQREPNTVQRYEGLEGGGGFSQNQKSVTPPHSKGRWPANLVLSHTPECREVGTKKVKLNGSGIPTGKGSKSMFDGGNDRDATGYANPDSTETVAAWECSEDCPVRLLDEQSGVLAACGGPQKTSVGKDCRSEIFKGFRTGRTNFWGESGGASRFFYCAKSSTKERNAGLPEGRKNTHPTVKPLKLMEYLCKLTMTPTGGIVLDPFAGSGSTLLAAQNVGREFIGIEKEAEHCETARLRLRLRQEELFASEAVAV